MQQLVYNAIRTPDGTLLVSRNRHDYKTHVDDNEEMYMLDGGLDYIRTSVNDEPAESLAVYLNDDFKDVRAVLEWGSRGVNGDEPLHYIKLSSMETDHIIAVLDECFYISEWRKDVMEQELTYRDENWGEVW